MSTAMTASRCGAAPPLLGQTVVVLGGSSGIGLETARRASAEGAKVILTGRNPERLQRAATELDAFSTAAFDATDFKLLERFFEDLPVPVDHVLATGPGPYYAPLADFDFERARRDIEAHLLLPLQIARNARNKVRPGGTLLFMSGTGGRKTAKGFALISALTAAFPLWQRTSRSRSRLCESTLLPPDSSTHRSRHNCLVINSKPAGISCAPLFP